MSGMIALLHGSPDSRIAEVKLDAMQQGIGENKSRGTKNTSIIMFKTLAVYTANDTAMHTLVRLCNA